MNLLQRHGNDLLVREIDLPRATVRKREAAILSASTPGRLAGSSALHLDPAARRQRLQHPLALAQKRVFAGVAENRAPVRRPPQRRGTGDMAKVSRVARVGPI